MSRRRRLWLSISAAAVLLIALVAGVLIYVSSANAEKTRKFEATSKAQWRKIGEKSRDVSAALARVGSVGDLAAVSSSAGEMVAVLDEASRSLAGRAVPPGYGDIASKQKAAIEAMKHYLEKVGQLASRGDQQAFKGELGILEDRSREASAAVSDFLTAARFVKTTVPGDFYQAALTMGNAWKPPDYANEAERQAVYDTAAAFINADISGPDLDTIWSMLSAKLRQALDVFKITRDKLASGWAQSWGDARPVEFYINRNDIHFTDQNTATAKVIMYMNRGGPRIETMRLVKENGVWKVETYPFVGWS